QGATEVYAYITHGVLSGGAVARITASRLKELVITDSIQPTQAVKVARNIRTLSVASLIGEAIGRTAAEESGSSLFDSQHSGIAPRACGEWILVSRNIDDSLPGAREGTCGETTPRGEISTKQSPRRSPIVL